MKTLKNKVLKDKSIGKLAVMIFCLAVIVIVASVLLFVYKPGQNALGALASVCLDTFSIIVMVILICSFLLEKNEIDRTTKLFIGLMIATLWALFMDFLTWSSDGSLKYAGWTFAFTMLSLCMGSILGGIFCLYLGNYMVDMYNLISVRKHARVCAIFNAVSFLITLGLGLSQTAFVFSNGHYEVGALYDIITVIPIMTLLYMTLYAFKHIKTIGAHDLCAVAGYILTMICGALLEAVFGVGTTYVSVTIANIIIFLMLQNKLIDRVKKQGEILTDRITNQYKILLSMAEIYSHVNYVDLANKIIRRFDLAGSINEQLDFSGEIHSGLNKRFYEGIEDNQKDTFWEYTDLSTLSDRMAGEKIISAEFRHKTDGWFRAQYIRIGDSVYEPLKEVIYTVINIDEEKKSVEKWIVKSNTDELTGFYNRHAYEDEISALEKSGLSDNFVYVSIDVNSLKVVNDNRGHEAGDELLIGAADCMKQCFGAYGKIFRTGGDEFAALIFADSSQLEEIKKDIDEVTEKWTGKLISSLAISCGYVTRKEAKNMSLREIAALADSRMYDAKTNYYREKGIDRRGQRDAHVALCALYTKILKINVTNDSYQIINMDNAEKTIDMGFSDKLSLWMQEFGVLGMVHPDDLDMYLKATNLANISDYFRNNNTSFSFIYRRKYGDVYKRVMTEMIPANDYSDNNQSLFLYVKNIEE